MREALIDGYVDQLVGVLNAIGGWKRLEEIEVDLEKDKDDVPNELLWRELATLLLLRIPNPPQAPTYLFQNHGVLRFLGFKLREIREGQWQRGESLGGFRREHGRGLVTHDVLSSGRCRPLTF